MKKHTTNGAVKIAILSPKGEIILVKNPERPDPLWVLPGGSIEDGETVLEAAVRETRDETGFFLVEEDIKLVHQEVLGKPYCPHLVFAVLDQRVFDDFHRTGDENGDLLLVQPFSLAEAKDMLDVVHTYRPFITELYQAFRTNWA